MLSASSLVLVILLMLGGTSGDSVNQTEGPVILIEGETLTLSCTYQTTYGYSVYLFWYVQYPEKEPDLLLKSLSDNQDVHNRGFQAKLVKTDSSFHLTKHSVRTSDSAVYYCAVSDTVREAAGEAEHKPRRMQITCSGYHAIVFVTMRWQWFYSSHSTNALNVKSRMVTRGFASDWLSHQQTGSLEHERTRHKNSSSEKRSFGIITSCIKIDIMMENMLECAVIVLWLQLGWLSGEDQVEQSPQTLRIQEQESVSLNCSYTVSTFRALQWYRQDPGKGPKFLFILYSGGKEQQNERLTAMLSQKGSFLHIKTPKGEDSATYLCAVETQCSPGTCTLYQNPAAEPLE